MQSHDVSVKYDALNAIDSNMTKDTKLYLGDAKLSRYYESIKYQ